MSFASKATAAPPAGNPQKIALVVAARRRGGLISLAIAIRFGSAPPKPLSR